MIAGDYDIAKTRWSREAYLESHHSIWSWAAVNRHVALFNTLNFPDASIMLVHRPICIMDAETKYTEKLKQYVSAIHTYGSHHWADDRVYIAKFDVVAAYFLSPETVDGGITPVGNRQLGSILRFRSGRSLEGLLE